MIPEFPFGSSLPLGKLRDPINPTAEAENVVLFFGGSFSPVHLNHLSVMEVYFRSFPLPLVLE